MPEKILKKINSCILPEWKVCFVVAILSGLFAHLYKITNWLPNWDSLVFRYDPQNMLALGRWFLPVVCSLTSFYDLPFLNGITAIIFHALSAVCICKVLNIHRKVTAALIGAVIVSFPTVTSVMMYNYVADGYSIAFFLSTLAVLFMTGSKPKYILSAVLIALSTGIYQAYITVTITLIILHLAGLVVFENVPFKVLIKKTLNMLVIGILGMLLYAAVLKGLLAVFSLELLEYQGVNATASLENLNLFASLYVVKETFIEYFFDLSNGVTVYLVLNIVILLFTFAYYLKCMIVKKLYKKPSSIFMVILLTIMFISGAAALAFVNASVDYHNLMLMGYSSFYLLFLVIYERGTETKEKHIAIKRWSVLVIALILIMHQMLIANLSYHKAQMAYEKSYGVLVRITDRIEQTPGTENCDRILVIGELDNSRAYSVNLPPDITGTTDGYIIRADDETVGQSVFCSAINDYCGKTYSFVSGDEKKELIQREDVKSMEKWPANTCVAVVDDTIVIKLGTEGEE